MRVDIVAIKVIDKHICSFLSKRYKGSLKIKKNAKKAAMRKLLFSIRSFSKIKNDVKIPKNTINSFKPIAPLRSMSSFSTPSATALASMIHEKRSTRSLSGSSISPTLKVALAKMREPSTSVPCKKEIVALSPFAMANVAMAFLKASS